MGLLIDQDFCGSGIRVGYPTIPYSYPTLHLLSPNLNPYTHPKYRHKGIGKSLKGGVVSFESNCIIVRHNTSIKTEVYDLTLKTPAK